MAPASPAAATFSSWAGGFGSFGVNAMDSVVGHGDPGTRYSTTILTVQKDGKLAMIGDGQMTQGSVVVKPTAKKVRRIGNDEVLVGFAGSTADALALMERLEIKLEAHQNQILRSAVELGKEWRTDKYLRRLEAALIVANSSHVLEITGNGDVLEPADGVLAIGSGSPFATAAARALMHTDMSAMEVAERAMSIAADMCVYTNHNFVKESLDMTADPEVVSQI